MGSDDGPDLFCDLGTISHSADLVTHVHQEHDLAIKLVLAIDRQEPRIERTFELVVRKFPKGEGLEENAVATRLIRVVRNSHAT